MGIESVDILAILFVAALAAGFIDAIAGGGGLITVPVLLLAGLSPLQALATNKLQGLFGAGAAAITYAAKGHVDLRVQLVPALISAVASALGAIVIHFIPADGIRWLIPLLLIAIALFFLFKPGLDDADRERRIAPALFVVLVVPLIGFYDGFLGPGTGSFFMIGFVLLAGYGVLKATAHTKLLNFASNVGGFLVFALGGSIVWKIGFVMALGQIAGAQLGARLAIKNGAAFIKPLLTLTCLTMAARILYDQL